jgi:hypothetical protein
MIRTNENTMLTRAEYRELAEKVTKEIIDKLPDDANPLMLLSTTIDLAIALKAMEKELFGEEEK